MGVTERGEAIDAGRWENEGGRYEGEREGRGNFPRYEDRSRDYQDDYRRERGEWSSGSRPADFGHRGDWGRQGSWGTYGNRPSYERARNEAHTADQTEATTNMPVHMDSLMAHTAGSTEGQLAKGNTAAALGSYSGGLGGFGEQGRHAGRGPKNWQRSDDRIKEDVNERLTEHPQIDATEIDIQVRNGEVTISGSVEDRRIKRMVEDLSRAYRA